MTPLLEFVEAYLLAHKRVCQSHAKAGAIAVVAALAGNFQTFEGQSLFLSVVLVNGERNLSAEPCLEAIRELLQAVSVPMPPLGLKGKPLERFKSKHPDDWAIVNPYAPTLETNVNRMLWFKGPRLTDVGDQRDYSVPPPPDLITACQQLHNAPGGRVGLDPNVARSHVAPTTDEDAILFKLATLFAIGDGRLEVTGYDELAAMELVLPNLSLEPVLH